MLSLLPFLFALCALTSAKNFTITFEGLPLNAAPPPTYANITWNGFTTINSTSAFLNSTQGTVLTGYGLGNSIEAYNCPNSGEVPYVQIYSLDFACTNYYPGYTQAHPCTVEFISTYVSPLYPIKTTTVSYKPVYPTGQDASGNYPGVNMTRVYPNIAGTTIWFALQAGSESAASVVFDNINVYTTCG